MSTYGWLLALGTAYLALLGWGLQVSIVLNHEADEIDPAPTPASWLSPVLAYQVTAFLMYMVLVRWMLSGARAWADLAEYQEFFVAGSAAVLGRQLVVQPEFPIPRAVAFPPLKRVVLQLAAGTPWWALVPESPVSVLGLEILPRWLGIGRPLSRIEEYFGILVLAAVLQWLAVYLQRQWRTFLTRRSLTPD